MAVKIQELMRKVNHMNIQVIAGKNGLGRAVTWVHMVENLEISDFLRGEELVFTTGVGLNDTVTLLQLIERIYQHGASGIVINQGPYIREITQDILDFANQHDFPVFRVPWEIHMAEIMRIFSFAIAQSEQNSMELVQAFRNAIYTPGQEADYVPALMNKGYSSQWNYIVAVIEVCQKVDTDSEGNLYASVKKERMLMLHKKIEAMVHAYSNTGVLILNNNYLILIFANQSEQDVASFVADIQGQTKAYLAQNEVFFTGIGRSTKSIRCVAKSFDMASKIIKMLHIENREMEICANKNMGVYRLLFAIEDKETILNYLENTIDPIREYDRLNKENLMEVLTQYLAYNSSMKETAEALFVHRNTVNYKLRKIEGILDMDLSQESVRLQLSIGLTLDKIRRMYHLN